MTPITRFTLEDQIMECYMVVDDLEMVYSAEALYQDQDRMMNILLGMHEIYKIRFERMLHTFEHLVHEGKIT